MAGFLRDEKGLSLLTLLIGYRVLKYSSWNEKEIKAFLTPGCKWTTNPWAGLLFILQLCKPQISFFPPVPTQWCHCVYTNKFLTDKPYNLVQLSSTSINKSTSQFFPGFKSNQHARCVMINSWWLWIFITSDWLASYRFVRGCLTNTPLKFLLGSVLGCGLRVESHLFKNGCECHSFQTILLSP